jgi:predicted nuclease of predicted toxin-antitoxin system
MSSFRGRAGAHHRGSLRMRLLFDQNLSRHLIGRLDDAFPESAHVSALGLSQGDDSEVWQRAESGGYTVVSKDSDFNDLLLLHGFPPFVIWIRRGNCSTSEIEALLRTRRSEIERLPESGNGLLVIQ